MRRVAFISASDSSCPQAVILPLLDRVVRVASGESSLEGPRQYLVQHGVDASSVRRGTSEDSMRKLVPSAAFW